jgi:hypothetical protein
MLYSASKRFIFSQAQRSASTSTAHFLQPFCCAPGMPISKGAMSEMVSEHGIIGARGPRRKESTFFSHMPAQAIRKAIPDEAWQNSLKIANIRNPYTRVLSVFSRLIRVGSLGGIRDLRRDFNDWFLASQPVEVYRPLFWIDQVMVTDHFIVFEDIAAQISVLCDRLEISHRQDFPHQQKSNDLIEGLSAADVYSDAARARIMERFQWVFDTFGYSTDPRDAQELPSCLSAGRGPALHAATGG